MTGTPMLESGRNNYLFVRVPDSNQTKQSRTARFSRVKRCLVDALLMAIPESEVVAHNIKCNPSRKARRPCGSCARRRVHKIARFWRFKKGVRQLVVACRIRTEHNRRHEPHLVAEDEKIVLQGQTSQAFHLLLRRHDVINVPPSERIERTMIRVRKRQEIRDTRILSGQCDKAVCRQRKVYSK